MQKINRKINLNLLLARGITAEEIDNILVDYLLQFGAAQLTFSGWLPEEKEFIQRHRDELNLPSIGDPGSPGLIDALSERLMELQHEHHKSPE